VLYHQQSLAIATELQRAQSVTVSLDNEKDSDKSAVNHNRRIALGLLSSIATRVTLSFFKIFAS